MVTDEKIREPYFNLKNEIERQKLNQKEVAEAIGMDRSLFNLKINRKNGRDFYLNEAQRIASHLKIKLDDFYF